MNIAFYTAAVGANAQQARLDTIANNMSNLQTDGYKAQSIGFSDLLYNNMKAQSPNNGDLTVGSGVRAGQTNFNFDGGALLTTDRAMDYAIMGNGYFAIYNMEEDRLSYTRNGSFHRAQMGENAFYLAAQNGDFVLDSNMELIPVNSDNDDLDIGVFDFANKNGILLQGENRFIPVEQNGEPILQTDVTLKRGYLEGSNVELPYEMTKMIETERAYQLSLRMIKTSDEIEETINTMR